MQTQMTRFSVFRSNDVQGLIFFSDSLEKAIEAAKGYSEAHTGWWHVQKHEGRTTASLGIAFYDGKKQ